MAIQQNQIIKNFDIIFFFINDKVYWQIKKYFKIIKKNMISKINKNNFIKEFWRKKSQKKN